MDITPKTQETKAKQQQVGLHKSKKLSKTLIHKMERKPAEWEKIVANHIFDKGLISKIYEELIYLNTSPTSKQSN